MGFTARSSEELLAEAHSRRSRTCGGKTSRLLRFADVLTSAKVDCARSACFYVMSVCVTRSYRSIFPSLAPGGDESESCQTMRSSFYTTNANMKTHLVREVSVVETVRDGGKSDWGRTLGN